MTDQLDPVSFRGLLVRIIQRNSDDDAKIAWEQVAQLEPVLRQKLLGECLVVDGGLDFAVAQFLYLYGFYFPQDLVVAIAPAVRLPHTVAWQVLVAQFSRREIVVHGRQCDPFDRVEGIVLAGYPPTKIGPICDLLREELARVDPEYLETVFAVMLEETSIGLMDFFADLLSSTTYDLRVRLFLVLAIKVMAKKIRETPLDRKQITSLPRLAGIVASKSEDRTLRHELAYVFLELPYSDGVAAIQRLIEDTREDGFGAAYLPELEKLLGDTRIALEGSTEEFEEFTGSEVAQLLSEYSQDSACADDPRTAAAFAHGRRIPDANGSTKVLVYSYDVVKQCLEQIEDLDAKDAAWCDSFVKLLVSAVQFNGPHEAAFWCLSAAIERLASRGRYTELPALIDLAASELSSAQQTIPADYVHRLGNLGQHCAKKASLSGNDELTEEIHEKVAKLVKGRDPAIEGDSLLALGILYGKQGRRSQARQALEKSCELLQVGEDTENRATALMNLGNLDLDDEKWEPAEVHLEAAEAIYRQLEGPEHLTGLPYCIWNLVELSLRRGLKDTHAAQTRLEEAIGLARSRMDDDLEAILIQQKRQLSGRNPEMNWWY